MYRIGARVRCIETPDVAIHPRPMKGSIYTVSRSDRHTRPDDETYEYYIKLKELDDRTGWHSRFFKKYINNKERVKEREAQCTTSI
jgi:hypothetical protein